MDKHLVNKSKFLSSVLRHNPGSIGITLDKNGWANVADLEAHISLPDMETIVSDNNKKRFEFDASKARIRAVQGHSVDVDLEYEPARPPAELYHGTTEDVLPLIKKGGLQKMNRLHVHLSADIPTAKIVAERRRKKTAILTVDTMQMYALNFKFYQAKNGVWLTDNVPAKFISFPKTT